MGLKDMVIIMRRPCLMEDEGRHFFIMGPLPRRAAQSWVAAQKAEYFKPSDYYILDHLQQKDLEDAS